MAAVTSEVRARLGDPHSSALFSRQHLVSRSWLQLPLHSCRHGLLHWPAVQDSVFSEKCMDRACTESASCRP